ncbi:sensor histidine kinase [Acuticoccus sp. MNP-M23]|uniref:sensor histidine kinase n=1 Tax=Acuticoccus sp. MNP-M23 TaxID=3072793 RepID=UPI002815A486|nr:sensor histidine kinase [Acuticoccus sp. MNP-M23]WMS43081.1 sensor histidine kinase [Acuticoccus sp. MNP-M23]
MSDLADASILFLIRAPIRNDAQMIAKVLAQDGIASAEMDGGADPRLFQAGTVLVCTQEGLTEELLETLDAVITRQPAWSRFAMVLLLDGDQEAAAVTARLSGLLADGIVTILHRPVRPLEFRTAVLNATRTRRKQLEMRDHLELQLELRRELNHRVKNTVATFHAIYRMTMRQSETLDDFSEKFSGRLRALSKVHELLFDADRAEPVLRELVGAIVAPYTGDEGHIVIEGDAVAIDREHALSLALVLNELATNAVKYGALSKGGGTVKITWQQDPVDSTFIDLQWEETTGNKIIAPEKDGYGVRFIRSAVAALAGNTSFDYRSDGLFFAMRVSIANSS